MPKDGIKDGMDVLREKIVNAGDQSEVRISIVEKPKPTKPTNTEEAMKRARLVEDEIVRAVHRAVSEDRRRAMTNPNHKIRAGAEWRVLLPMLEQRFPQDNVTILWSKLIAERRLVIADPATASMYRVGDDDEAKIRVEEAIESQKPKNGE